MKSIPFFKSNGIYVAASFASANTFFFTNVNECEILYSNLRRYLFGMIEIIEIRCFPGGWILLFKSKSTFQIKKTYLQHCKNKSSPRFDDVEHILSEQFRIANSMTVRACNALFTRSGSRVHSKLVKMIFESDKDYHRFLKKLTDVKVFSNQKLASFYPEFGKMVMDCRMEHSGFHGQPSSRKKKNNLKKLQEAYGEITSEFYQHYQLLKKLKSHYFKEISEQVTLKYIESTMFQHKRQFPMRFSVFEIP